MGASGRAVLGIAVVPCLGRIAVSLLVFGGMGLIAQPVVTQAKPASPALVLKAGEALAITLGDDEVGLFGDAKSEAAMGGLAELVWLRLEGAEWSARDIRYRCMGSEGPLFCSNKAGHGRMDLGKALRDGCNLAFLAWIQDAQRQWRQDYGEPAARARMLEVFAPFLGRRLPSGDGLPPFTLAWVGEGELLKTSPDDFLRWLMAPDQGQVVVFGTRFLAGAWSEIKELMGKDGWWFKTALAPVSGDPVGSVWVVGGRGSALVVYHLNRGRNEKEGLARVRELLKQNPR